MLEKELQKLGLSEKEARVYLAALELGPAPVQKISQKAKVNRATTYVVIEDLKDMGLMSTYEEGKKTYFVAEQPERLLSHLKVRENEIHEQISLLEQRLPELRSIFNAVPDKPRVKYFEGIEGLREVQKDFFETLTAGGEVYTFLPYDKFLKLKPLLKVKGYTDKNSAGRIRFKIIYTSSHGRETRYEQECQEFGDEIIYIDNTVYPFAGGMNIYQNKIFMIDYLGRTGGVLIENATIANLLRSIFLLIWNERKNRSK